MASSTFPDVKINPAPDPYHFPVCEDAKRPRVLPELLNPDRGFLIDKLSKLEVLNELKVNGDTWPDVDSVTWALLWLADVEQLERFVNDPVYYFSRVLVPARKITTILKWASRLEPLEAIAPAVIERLENLDIEDKDMEDVEPKKESVTDLCIKRDPYCAITNAGEPLEVARICPSSLMLWSQSERHLEDNNFWGMLECFWNKKRVESWREAVAGPEGTEVLKNMLCLSCDAERLWRMGRFALQPLDLSQDGKILRMRFFWLPRAQYSISIPMTTLPSVSSTLDHVGNSTFLYNCLTDRAVRSGDEITMSTADPVALPLPSLQLLEMQWMLTRVLGLSGLADAEADEFFGTERVQRLGSNVTILPPINRQW
ncbi:HNH endonuclease signature motif containing protein [Aspergillus mulundensis]|uniref:HNH nuclease domain-containing protein n=1 Tax=Aspergillus mulundensis TaxID=1810919 RepID=A0A3D8SCQ4_9EURO|nr:hypothetical protein DSM5745_04389 [Aspergillus mulundensis]RDW84063.1 hypothetical protein DSM5745_04389 [Aspergillus mulundensis]